jgi:peptidoglycan/xylan/chitin deacetylase (PgdA/CDA1 family)
MAAMTILTYHSLDQSGSVVSVRPELFAEHMKAIAGLGMRGISLREAVATREAEGKWPLDCVVITFDDGFENFHEAALPVLSSHGFSATLFLVTGHVGGRNDWAAPPEGLGEMSMLTWEQIADLAAAGIEIGAHTRTHPDLRELPDSDLDEEIRSSKREIEARIRGAVTSFAYPFGYFDSRTVSAVRREFSAACTTVLRRAAGDDPLLLPRVDAYYVRTGAELARIASGNRDAYLTLRRIGRGIRSKLSL